jgi:cyclohexyl-isocyanide hydratase
MTIIGMILFEEVTQLDLTGPLEVLSRMPDTTIHLVSKTLAPVRSGSGLVIVPDTTFETCPKNLTILFIPGGPGISGVLRDKAFLDFIRSMKNATYITSVCTGSIALAACGLLDGYKATTHWLSVELLRRFNVEVVNERVVVDRNRITGGGVTSGIDFAFMLVSILKGSSCAKEIQLLMEYHPQPPFQSGHPDVAEPSMVAQVVEQRAAAQKERLSQIDHFINSKST